MRGAGWGETEGGGREGLEEGGSRRKTERQLHTGPYMDLFFSIIGKAINRKTNTPTIGLTFLKRALLAVLWEREEG